MKLKQLVTGFITVATLAGVGVSGVAATTVKADDDKSSLTAKNDALLKQIQTANEKTAKLSNDVSNKALDIKNAEEKISASQAKIASYNQQIVKAQVEVGKRKDNLKEQLISLQKQVGNSVTGNIYFDFVLNSNSLTDLVGRSLTVNKLSQASAEALQAVKDSQAKVKTLQTEQEAKQETLVATKSQLESDKAKIESLKSDAEKSASDLQQTLEANKDKLAQLAASEDAAKAAAATDAVAATPSASSTSTASISAASSSVNTSTNTSTTSASSSASASQAPASNTSSVSVSGGSIASNAAKYIGVPYVYGGTSPSGFDCSGLIYYAAKEAGISLPRTSQAQSTLGSYVSVSDLKAGDLVFWGGVGSAYHVGIYIGGGQYLHAPAPGQNVTIQSMAYFAPSFGRRL
ncbi:C40 family peptidase [Lacticaseibacillus paracasei]|uniref:Gamma-D-glutamyl-L-lysine endopeptidase n=1 Tax=Lacticaseibacillus paracasei TaxID=1597 RepID=A0A8B3GTJ6_LACPA|nr:C40 family peptidase [Lacticaseibacillus paracasei]MDM7529712.1 NlpC/P60 family protein [Lacticaseibacillus paracasei]MDM7541827.1 NlpC/P60 family protein [Lacticaseibacillus paracasei]RND35719.1 Gamma-D-glutamyl-L-lysine endopeptidase [Lacticaseibacillus paracasei]RND45327.1 Gamma-D-glutamyl-L-lysine endopeptidase [Lacticaseibacillus paracasei]RND72226.1 Gamma-D-glutamyl-L-lysine endopeptidase [Lacticaseibacillus paracasei]